VIVRVYSAIVLQLHQRGVAGLMARKNAITLTAQAVSKMTGNPVSQKDVEAALASGGAGHG
jgi:hypothetical protein